MNKKRAEFIYKFTGTIHSRQLLQAPPSSKYTGQKYYRLVIKLENQNHSTKSLSVYKNKLENPLIWKALKQAHYGQFTHKKYLFHCHNVRGYYNLVDWEELATEGGSE